jgi:hypothetical protein
LRVAQQYARPVQPDETPPFDETLWFACSLTPGSRDYVVGNAHTFLGRLLAYCERKEGSPHYYASASEVLRECSTETGWWVRGFLAGAEPEPPRDLDGDFLAFDHPEMALWRQRTSVWAESGVWSDDR